MNISVAGVFQQSPDGTRTQFWTVGNISPQPNSMFVWDNFPLIPNIGFTASGHVVTFTIPPNTTDNLFWQGFISS